MLGFMFMVRVCFLPFAHLFGKRERNASVV
jgi:hypothetical protein